MHMHQLSFQLPEELFEYLKAKAYFNDSSIGATLRLIVNDDAKKNKDIADLVSDKLRKAEHPAPFKDDILPPIKIDDLRTHNKRGNKVLTVEEACKLLKVSAPTIYKLIHGGELKAYQLGRRWYINDDRLIR